MVSASVVRVLVGFWEETDVGLRFAGFFITKGMKKLMKKQRVGPVSEIIDHWNYVRRCGSYRMVLKLTIFT